MIQHATKLGKYSTVLATAVLVAGCSDAAGPSAADEELLRDVALLAADATLEDLALWGQPFGFGPPPTAGPAEAPGRPGGRHGWSGELSGTRSVTFFDADGAEQDAYDPVTTAVIHIVHEIMGEASREDWSVNVHRERDMEVSGLEGEETQRTWNGSGSEEVDRDRLLEGGETHSFHATGTFTYDDVVVPIPGTEPRYPLSGSIARSMSVTATRPDGERTRNIEVVITFDGTAIATAVVNGEVMEIDLSAREGRHPLHRPRG
jgi:hypothetical protein